MICPFCKVGGSRWSETIWNENDKLINNPTANVKPKHQINIVPLLWIKKHWCQMEHWYQLQDIKYIKPSIQKSKHRSTWGWTWALCWEPILGKTILFLGLISFYKVRNLDKRSHVLVLTIYKRLQPVTVSFTLCIINPTSWNFSKCSSCLIFIHKELHGLCRV